RFLYETIRCDRRRAVAVGSGHRKHDHRLSRALQPAGDQEPRRQAVARSVLRAKSWRALEAGQEIEMLPFPNASIGGSTTTMWQELNFHSAANNGHPLFSLDHRASAFLDAPARKTRRLAGAPVTHRHRSSA